MAAGEKHAEKGASKALMGTARLKTVVLLSVCNMICYADRVNIGVAIIPMTVELQMDKTTETLVLSSFFWGYLLTQSMAGVLCRRYGPANVLIAAVLVWSLMTLLTPPAAHHSTAMLVAARVVMGLGEGLSQPVIHQLLSAWAPPVERSRLVAIASAGQPLGTVAAMLSSPIAARHWPSVFTYFGAAGIVWCAVAASVLRDRPRVADGVSPTEVEYVESSVAAEKAMASSRRKGGLQSTPPLPMDLPSLLTTKHFVAIYVAHFCTNWSIYIVISWVPTYLSSLGASLDSVGGFAVLPYLCYWAVDVGWAQYLDRAVIAGTSLRRARIMSQAVCTIGPSFALAWMVFNPPKSPSMAIALLCWVLGTNGTAHSGYWANILDIAPEGRSADLLGISNTIATIPGIVGNIWVGFVLATYDSWELVWISALVLNLVSYSVFREWCRAGSTSFSL